VDKPELHRNADTAVEWLDPIATATFELKSLRELVIRSDPERCYRMLDTLEMMESLQHILLLAEDSDNGATAEAIRKVKHQLDAENRPKSLRIIHVGELCTYNKFGRCNLYAFTSPEPFNFESLRPKAANLSRQSVPPIESSTM